jgi:hypothetical protein
MSPKPGVDELAERECPGARLPSRTDAVDRFSDDSLPTA